MGLTLVEAAKLVDNPKRQAIIEIFAKSNDILGAIPFDDVPGSGVDYNREGTLPGVAFRGINGSYTASTGVLNPQHDPLKVAGGTLDVDRALTLMQGMGVRSTQEAMKVKALSGSIAKSIIKGDSTDDPAEFDGLQRRLVGDQKIIMGANSTAAATALSLAKLDETIDAVDDPTHIIMNKTTRRKLTAASRLATVGGDVTTSVDQWGRQVYAYGGLPILISGKDNTATEIIPLTEVAGDDGTDGTSLYVVSFGDGMLTGIQNGIMAVVDLGLRDDVFFRTLVEWLVGIALYHPRAAARLWSIDATAAVTV